MSHKASSSQFLTPPKFLEMAAVSVEILDRGIRFLTVRKTNQSLVPDKFGFLSLASGIIVQGEIMKRDLVIKALAEIQKKTLVNFVRFSVPEDKTYIFTTHLPTLKPEEIRNILDFKLEENIPLTSKEAVFDYDIAQSKKGSDGLDLVVSVAPLKLIEDFQALFLSAGLTPVLFSPESNNVAKSVVRSLNQQVLMIVNIKESNIVLSLVVSGIVYQTSSISLGGSSFTDLLAKYYSVSNEEALKMKANKLYIDNQDSSEIFSHMINTLSVIKDEIYKFVSYCNERKDVETKVDRVLLCGQEAMIVGLATYLSSNLNLPVDVANIWVNNFKFDDYIPALSQLESQDYAVVNGLNLL